MSSPSRKVITFVFWTTTVILVLMQLIPNKGPHDHIQMQQTAVQNVLLTFSKQKPNWTRISPDGIQMKHIQAGTKTTHKGSHPFFWKTVGQAKTSEVQCNPSFATTSLEQYETYKLLFEAKSFPKLKTKDAVNEWHRRQKFNPKTDIFVKNHSDMTVEVTVLITEQDSKYTKGGASLKIHFASDNFVVSYPIKDFFNGTYFGCYFVQRTCITVTIRLLFLSFAAYFPVQPCPLSDVIKTETWCPTENRTEGKENVPCNMYPERAYRRGIWMKRKKTTEKPKTQVNSVGQCDSYLTTSSSFQWLWVDPDRKCYVRNDDLEDRWQKCARRYSSMHLFGDSHTRGIFRYISRCLGCTTKFLDSQKWVDSSFRNLFLHMVNYNDSVAKSLAAFLEAIKKATFNVSAASSSGRSMGITEVNNTVIAFGFGSWELQFHNLTSYIDTVHLVISVIKNIQHFTRHLNIKWIYMTHPSAWDDSACFCTITFMHNPKNPLNIFSTAAANQFTIQQLRRTGVKFDVFDFHSLTVHRNNEAVDYAHYLTNPGQPWSVGQQAMDILLTSICPEEGQHKKSSLTKHI